VRWTREREETSRRWRYIDEASALINPQKQGSVPLNVSFANTYAAYPATVDTMFSVAGTGTDVREAA
jgi:hypothetical protein